MKSSDGGKFKFESWCGIKGAYLALKKPITSFGAEQRKFLSHPKPLSANHLPGAIFSSLIEICVFFVEKVITQRKKRGTWEI